MVWKKDILAKFIISSGRLGVIGYAWHSTTDWKQQLTRICRGYQNQLTKSVVLEMNLAMPPLLNESEICSLCELL